MASARAFCCARVAYRLERVGRFAGLADGQHQRLLVEHRVAVAELGGHLDLHRDPGPVFDRLLADQPGVVGRAAGNDEHLVDVAQLLRCEPLLVQHDPAVHQMPEQGVGYRFRLLLNLLEHEEVVATLLRGGKVPVDVERTPLDRRPGEVRDPAFLRTDLDHLVLAEFDGLPGVGDERRDVAAQEHLAVAHTHDKGRVASGGDHKVGLGGVEHDEGERTLEAAAHHSDGVGERERTVGQRSRNKVHDRLRVGVADHLDTGCLEFGPQRREVLDDAVVHERQTAGLVGVRVCVAVGRGAVRRPPGVPDARVAGEGHPGAIGAVRPVY